MIPIGMSYGSAAPVAALVPGQLTHFMHRLDQEADFTQGVPLRDGPWRSVLDQPISPKQKVVENVFCGIKQNGEGKWVDGDGPIQKRERMCFISAPDCAKYLRRVRGQGILLAENEWIDGLTLIQPDLVEATPHHGHLPSQYTEWAATGTVKGIVADTLHLSELPRDELIPPGYHEQYEKEGGFWGERFLREAGPFFRLIHVQFDRNDSGREMLDFENWRPGDRPLLLHKKIAKLIEHSCINQLIGILLEPSAWHWLAISKIVALRPALIASHLCRQRDSLRSWLDANY